MPNAFIPVTCKTNTMIWLICFWFWVSLGSEDFQWFFNVSSHTDSAYGRADAAEQSGKA